MTRQAHTRLGVEVLEGRVVPAGGWTEPFGGPRPAATASVAAVVAPPAAVFVADPVPTVRGPAASPSPGARVLTRIYVNGELVLRVWGRPQFAGLGPAASGDATGSTHQGGVSIFANGRHVGTFAEPPQVNRTVVTVPRPWGQPVRVITYHFNGPLTGPATPASGPAYASGAPAAPDSV